MKFLVDDMLGSLARFLRMAGHDTMYAGDLDGEDDELLQYASSENRTIVTRDVELSHRAGDAILLRTRDLDEQLEAMARRGVELEPAMTRCSLCNSPLEEIEETAEVEEEYVPEDARDLKRCTGCGQYYWRGSHWDRIEDRLRRARNQSDEDVLGDA